VGDARAGPCTDSMRTVDARSVDEGVRPVSQSMERTRTNPLWRDVRVIRGVLQLAFVVGVFLLIGWLFGNLATNLDRLGIRRDFAFLQQPAGFRILGSDFAASGTIQEAMLVGLRNTVRVALVGMALALLLGIVVGVARLSRNWLVAQVASGYVELFRNVPPLVLVIIFYQVTLDILPRIEDSWSGAGFILSNRGVWSPWLEVGEGSRTFLVAIVVGVIAALLVVRWRLAAFERTGVPAHAGAAGSATAALIVVAAWLVLDPPIAVTIPLREGRLITGGVSLYPEYLSLLLAMVLYTASFIAEIVRGSIQAVHRGQAEAADALGLAPGQRLRLVVLPQALRIAAPATGNEFLNLTKNVSLGIAVGYAELLRVAQTATGNGQPAPQSLTLVLLGYLSLSIIISLVVNIANRRLQLVER
jgi:general L-amino acid transport system permease protein